MNTTSPRIAVLIPAAGHGARMGGTRKQFRRLGSETLLLRTLRLFADHPRIAEVVVAAPEDHTSEIRKELMREELAAPVRIVPGGSSRQASVASALRAADPQTDIVLVHDAVRPFLPPDRIDAVIEGALQEGAAALALDVADTLRTANGAVFAETLDRSGIVRMQTPQAFRYDWFIEAHQQAEQSGRAETDDVGLVQHAGRQVRIVEGSALNFKVTTPADWVLAQALWHYLAPET